MGGSHPCGDPSGACPGEIAVGKAYDPRGFVVARHPRHGYLVLFALKKKKGLHGQLPGGHVDGDEVDAYGSGVRSATVAAARELFEETGIDVRGDLKRLDHVRFPDAAHELSTSPGGGCESGGGGGGGGGGDHFKGRFFFRLELTDADSTGAGAGCVRSKGGKGKAVYHYGGGSTTVPVFFTVRLSKEHVEWVFEEDEERVASMIDLHSGGKVATGFRVATAAQLHT